MSRRRRTNPLQTSLFHEVTPPARTKGQRIKIKARWNETGRGDAEDAAEVVRGVMIDRLDSKLGEFTDYLTESYGFSNDEAVNLFQWFQTALFPESFDVDLDCEGRKQGLLPRCGGDKLTAKQIEAFAAVMREGMERRK